MNISVKATGNTTPLRYLDYSAIDTDTYDWAPDADPQAMGMGATQIEAIEDLIRQLGE